MIFSILQKYWKYLVVLVLLVVSFGAGRYATPTKIETREKIVEKQVLVAGKDTHTVEFKDRVITKVVVKAPDGTVTVTTKDEDKGHVDTVKKEVVTVFKDREVEKVKLVEHDAPRLHLDLLVGYSATKWAALPSLGSEHLAIGVSASYRVLGPVSVGAWVLSTGAAGASVGVSF